MIKRTRWIRLAALSALVAPAGAAFAQTLPAFPGAEGFGAGATMRKNNTTFAGNVYHVTNLNDSGAGSLRQGVVESGFPAGGRIIVFDVGGTINLLSSLDIKNVNGLYIAGQTAPAPITVVGDTSQITSSNSKITQNVIARYLTFRKGTGNGEDAITFAGSGTGQNLILDHISASWGEDETLSVANNNTNVTVQYSIIAESLNNADHGFGSLVRPRVDSNVSFHHNLYANNKSRNPRAGSYDNTLLTYDFRNNTVYNSSDRNGYAGGSSEPEQERVHLNYVGNYVIAGPSSVNNIDKVFLVDKNVDLNAYQSGNFIDSDKQTNPGGQPNGTDQGWNAWEKLAIATDSNWVQETSPIAAAPVITQSAVDAYNQVLTYVGNSWANRSAVDARIVNNVRTNTGAVINNTSAITTEYNAILATPMSTRPAGFDADNDGMADAWEVAHGGTSLTALGDFDTDGYSNIEEYVNDLGAIPAPRVINWTGGPAARYALNDKWDTWQPSQFDTVTVNNGKATVDAVGQHAGTLKIGQLAGNVGEVEVTGGWLDVASTVDVGSAGPGGAGTLRLTGGSLAIGSALNLNSTGTLILGGGTLALNGAGQFNWNGGTLRTTVNQGIGLNASIGASGAILDTTDRTVAYSGNLTGIGGFTKQGTGSVTLSGVNAYQGTTTVSGGSLTFARSSAASSSSKLSVASTASATLAQQATSWVTNTDARYTMPDLAVATGGVLDVKNNKLTLTSPTITESDLRTMKADGRLTQSTGVANRAVGYTQSGPNLVIAYAGIGDSNLDGQSSSADISALVLAGKYTANGSGPAATWDEGDWTGDGKASAADVSALVLSGLYGAGQQSNLVAPGLPGDGVASIVYNIVDGSLKLSRDGDARDIREIRIASASGAFVIANAENVGALDVNDPGLQDRFSLSGPFADGYDLGNLLAGAGITYNPLTDLTVEYGVFGGGNLVAGDLTVVPEPSMTVSVIAGIAGILTWRRRGIGGSFAAPRPRA